MNKEHDLSIIQIQVYESAVFTPGRFVTANVCRLDPSTSRKKESNIVQSITITGAAD